MMDIKNAKFLKFKENNNIYRLYFSFDTKIVDCYVGKNMLMEKSKNMINKLYPGDIVSINILSGLVRQLLAINNRDIEYMSVRFYWKRIDLYSVRIRDLVETDLYYRFSITGFPTIFPLDWFWLQKDNIGLIDNMVVTFSCFPKRVGGRVYARVSSIKPESEPLDWPQCRLSEVQISNVDSWRDALYLYICGNYIEPWYQIIGHLSPDSEKLIDLLIQGEKVSITFEYKDTNSANIVKINDIPIKYSPWRNQSWSNQLWNYIFPINSKCHKE